MKKKMIVAYGSTTGNTEKAAQITADYFEDLAEVKMVSVTDIKPKDLGNYDLIVLGSSTWGDGELQDDFIPFYEEMNNLNLAGKKAAAFGTGETSWPQFCKAVDLIAERLEESGAQIEGNLKIDGEVEANQQNIDEWLKNQKAFFLS